MDLATTDRGGAVGIRVYRPFASMVMAVCAYCRCRIRAKGCRLSEFAGESRARGDAVRRGGGGRTERTRPAGPGGHKPQLATTRADEETCGPRRRPVRVSSTAGLRSAVCPLDRGRSCGRCACRVFIRYKSPHRLTHRPAQVKNT